MTGTSDQQVMASSLRNTLEELAAAFAADVLDALRGMSLEDILTVTRDGLRVPEAATARGPRPASVLVAPDGLHRPDARLRRRSADAIGAVVTRIVELLAAHPKGLRSEQIRDALGLRANEMPRPLREALAQSRVVKEGEKRATTYFAARARGRAKAPRVDTPPKRGAQKKIGRRPSSADAPPDSSAKPEA